MPTPKEQTIAALYKQLENPALPSEEFDAILSRIERLEQVV